MSKSTAKKRTTRTQKSFIKRHPIRSRFIAVATVVAIIGGIAFYINNRGNTNTPTAGAIQTELCGNWGAGYCLNNWNNGGLGNHVKMYNGGVSNENFSEHDANVCGGNHFVTATCPFINHNFNHHNWNADYLNAPLVIVGYNPKGLCVGSDLGSSVGYLRSCTPANNTVFVSHNAQLINVGFTSATNVAYYLCSSGYKTGPVLYDFQDTSRDGCNWSQGY